MVEFNPEWYEKFIQSTDEKKVIISKISDILKNKPCESCLEIGLGTYPFFAEILSKNFEKYVVVEKQKQDFRLPERVELINNDWESVDLEEKFDVIIASHVFYYFKNKKRAVEKMFSHLNEDGRIIFVVNGKTADYGPIKLAFAKMINKKYLFTYDEVYELIKNHKIREYTSPTEVNFDSFEDLFETLKLIFDNHEEEYKNNKEKLIDYFKRNLKAGKFVVDMKILEVTKAHNDR
ncbi:methyltransferase domain-containing protein [Candidatus Pacearchaeota archaeon]|nr:methyltransferase domain-containing protein [Candidatus Pacearchaeota archaeon]MBD3283050.1 methyltransferase domain-containing protein [Candidatus Pacearchaeota archaeon]